MFILFVLCLFFFRSSPEKTGLEPLFTYLEHANVNLVGAGATFNLNRHKYSLSCLFSLRLAVLHCELADYGRFEVR